MARVMKSVSYSYVERYKFPFSLEILCIDSEGILVDIIKKFATYEELKEAMNGVAQLLPEGEPVEEEEMAAYA